MSKPVTYNPAIIRPLTDMKEIAIPNVVPVPGPVLSALLTGERKQGVFGVGFRRKKGSLDVEFFKKMTFFS